MRRVYVRYSTPLVAETLSGLPINVITSLLLMPMESSVMTSVETVHPTQRIKREESRYFIIKAGYG